MGPTKDAAPRMSTRTARSATQATGGFRTDGSSREMLAVFDKSVAKSREGLRTEEDGGGGASTSSVVEQFTAAREGAVTISLGEAGFLAYAADKQNLHVPRLFAVVDDIFCLFQGYIENIIPLKQQYGLNKTANEVTIVIEDYKTLRDKGPYSADKVVRDLGGKFAFVLFDGSSKSTFIAADADGSLPFFWGTHS